MKQHNPGNESSKMTDKMPFLAKHQQPLFPLNADEIARRVLPIFGGTSPTETKTTESSSGDSGQQSSSANATDSQNAGGDSGKPKELSPEEIASLLEQVNETNTKLTEATQKLTEYEQKEQSAKRAAMGKEEALTADLEQAQQTIIKMDQALKNQAVINAINGFRDLEFHDTGFILRELQSSAPEIFEDMEVDLDNSTVTVKGVENHLRRIAREKDWAVKKNNNPGNNGNKNGAAAGSSTTPPPRGSGAPPANPAASGDKASRRAALATKFPVISHGRKM